MPETTSVEEEPRKVQVDDAAEIDEALVICPELIQQSGASVPEEIDVPSTLVFLPAPDPDLEALALAVRPAELDVRSVLEFSVLDQHFSAPVQGMH
jgi:hypothetical protein